MSAKIEVSTQSCGGYGTIYYSGSTECQNERREARGYFSRGKSMSKDMQPTSNRMSDSEETFKTSSLYNFKIPYVSPCRDDNSISARTFPVGEADYLTRQKRFSANLSVGTAL